MKKKQTNKRKESSIFSISNENLLIIFIILLLIQILCFNLYSNKLDYLKELVIKQEEQINSQTSGKTIFLGDSITEYYDISKYYNDDDYLNKGVSGETTEDILNRMKESVYDYNPKRVILLIGTNDLQKNKSTDEISENIREIVTRILKNNKNTKVYVESISPVNKEIRKSGAESRTNKDIKAINSEIKKICSELDIVYINTYDELVDNEGNFEESYTEDGLHFSDKGYRKLTSLINKAIRTNEKSRN